MMPLVLSFSVLNGIEDNKYDDDDDVYIWIAKLGIDVVSCALISPVM